MLLLDRQAEVLACGQGAHGALGLGDTESRTAPTPLRALAGTGVRQVRALLAVMSRPAR